MPTTSAGGNGSTATDNVAIATGSFTPAANDLLIAMAITTGQAAGGAFTDSTNLGWSNVLSVLLNTSADTLVIAVANKQCPAAVAMTVTFTPAGGPVDTGAAISVFRVAGMRSAGLAAIRQSASQANQAAVGTPAPVFATAPLTGNTIIGAIGNGTNPATMTPPATFTEVDDIGYATPTAGLETVFKDGGFTTPTVTWGGTSASAFASAVIELDTPQAPAGGGGPASAFAYIPDPPDPNDPYYVPPVPKRLKSRRSGRWYGH